MNAACSGPRRPRSVTRRTLLSASAASAYSGTSVLRSASTPQSSTRAQSIATLPMPTTAAASQSASPNSWLTASGWPLYQLTNSRAARTPRSDSPGTPSSRSAPAPHASTTAEYARRSSGSGSRLEDAPALAASPTHTLPKKPQRGSAAICAKRSVTFFTSWWSGATPYRTRPNGSGSCSKMSTCTSASWRKRWSAA